MGYRLHVCKEYRVIHGDGEFNGIYNLISNLFYHYCENVWQSESGDVWEIPFEDFEDFLKTLNDNKKEIRTKYRILVKEWKYIINTLQEMYDQADKRNQCIRLEWF